MNIVAIDTIWTLIAAILVFMMQAGFAMLETGLTRSKNATNIMMKNLMDFSIGTLAFWMVGYGIMFGVDSFFLTGATAQVSEGLSTFTTWMFHVVFAATAATIVSGAVAERTQFKAYLIYTVFITALIYPVVGRWIWGGGWLSDLGFVDFAGSTVVHSVGGWAGLAGAFVLGPRFGKYVKKKVKNASTGVLATFKEEIKEIPGHSVPLAALGVFLLWFGWFGFNAGSTTSGVDLSIARIMVTTNLAAAAGAVAALFFSWLATGKPNISHSLNGAIAGLVAITAGCATVSPSSAAIIGFIGGVVVVLSTRLFERKFKIDDPVGAVSAHGVAGAWGTIAVGLFADSQLGGGLDGLLFGGGFYQLFVQTLGVVAVFGWTIVTSLILFYAIDRFVGLRVSRDEEMQGLDIGEHGVVAYSGFHQDQVAAEKWQREQEAPLKK